MVWLRRQHGRFYGFSPAVRCIVTRETEMLFNTLFRPFRRLADKPAQLGVLTTAVLLGATAIPASAPAQQSPPAATAPPAVERSAISRAKPSSETVAKPAPKTAAAKKKSEAAKDPAAAQAEVENGMTALGQGRADAAVGHLTTAITSGALPSQQSARALYYRGVAYRRAAKPAQAISDLTNSLWIKGGLTDEQRADALQQRSGAYREAGLPDQGEPQAGATQTAGKATGKTTGKANAASAPTNATPFSALAPGAPVAASGSSGGGVGGFFSSIFGGGASAPTTAPSPAPAPAAAPAPVQAAAPAVRSSNTAVAPAAGSASQTRAAPSASSAPVAAAPPTSAVGADGQPKPVTRRVPITTDATSSLPAGFQDLPGNVREVEVNTTARAPRPDVAAKAWDQGTEVKAGPAVRQSVTPAAKVGAPPIGQLSSSQSGAASPSQPPTSTAKAKSAGGPATQLATAQPAAVPSAGGLQVQVAATRSAEEARALAQRLQSQYAQELGGRAPVVEQSPVGTSGAIYRVSVGPFASPRQTDNLCARLKEDGLECRVTTR